MMQSSRIARNALIGETIAVAGAKNAQLTRIKGIVTDETKNMLVVQTDTGEKKIIKSQVTIEVNNKQINGTSLIGRIEARIKQ